MEITSLYTHLQKWHSVSTMIHTLLINYLCTDLHVHIDLFCLYILNDLQYILHICMQSEKVPCETCWNFKSKSRIFLTNPVQIHSKKTPEEKARQTSPEEDTGFHL